MTKKRIADLLKEEVEKPDGDGSTTGTAKAPTETGPSAKASSRTKKRTSSTSRASSSKSASTTSSSTRAKSASSKSASKKSASSKSAKADTAAKGNTSKAAASKSETAPVAQDPNPTIKALEISLQKANEQIDALQADVSTHQARIFELKDSLQQAENTTKQKDTQLKQLTDELETAKATIRKLTEANREKAAQAADKAAADKAAADKAHRKSLTLQRSRTTYSSYKSIPEYAIQRGTPAGGQANSMMSDDDIGWVD